MKMDSIALIGLAVALVGALVYALYARRTPRPVLLITDIGRDIDDTLALLTLLGSKNVELVGVVTSGGCSLARTGVARGWLGCLRAGFDAPIVGGNDDGVGTPSAEQCYVPDGFSPMRNGDACLNGPEVIVKLCQQWRRKLTVVVIGPLTPMARALALPGGRPALRSVGAVYLQGQADVTTSSAGAGGTLLTPSVECFNFREAMPAAELVFAALQAEPAGVWDDPPVPLSLLGKHAAYACYLTVSDFSGFASTAPPAAPDLAALVVKQMDGFRRKNPTVFYQLYPVPKQYRTDEAWHQNTAGGVLCHPYDPLCVLLLLRPELFRPRTVGIHTLVGNGTDDCGVPSPLAVHEALCALIAKGLKGASVRRAPSKAAETKRSAAREASMPAPTAAARARPRRSPARR